MWSLDGNSRTAALAWIALVALTATGCDPYYSVSKRASCSTITPAQIRAVVASDATTSIRDFEPWNPITIGPDNGREVLSLWAMRGREVVHVTVREDPAVVTLTAGLGSRPDEELRARWWRSVNELADRLSVAHPELGPWEREDHTQPNRWIGTACLSAVALILVVVTWQIRLRAVRRRTDSAET